MPPAAAAKASAPSPKWPLRFSSHYQELLGRTEDSPLPTEPRPAGPKPQAPPPVAPPPRQKPPARASEAPPARPTATPQADTLYSNLLKYCCDLAAAGVTGAPISAESLKTCSKALVAGIKADPSRLLSLSLDNQLPGVFHHTANVAIISLYLVTEMDVSESALELLCYISMIHDIGMYDIAAAHIDELTQAPRTHRVNEIQEWQRRLKATLDIVRRIFSSDPALMMQIVKCVNGIHDKRISSHNEAMPIACWIVRLAEIYEALTHQRPWREALLPNIALTRIIQQKGQLLGSQLIELAITRLTMFPPGSYMELSTEETAQVVSLNQGSLSRPLVQIINLAAYPPVGEHLVDLLKNPTIHINRQILKPSVAHSRAMDKNNG